MEKAKLSYNVRKVLAAVEFFEGEGFTRDQAIELSKSYATLEGGSGDISYELSEISGQVGSVVEKLQILAQV